MIAGVVRAREKEIADLCRLCGVRRLDVFGSAVTGSFEPSHSDVDFLVEFRPLEAGERADAYFRLLEGLTALLGRSVDLVVDRSIRNRYFRQAVDERREVLYAA